MPLDLSQETIRPPQRSSSGCGKGCLIAVIVVLVLVVSGGAYVYFNFKSLATKAVAAAIKAAVEEMDLPAEDKKQIIVRIDRLRDDFIAGKINEEQLERIFKRMTESPALPAGMVYFMQQRYVTNSPLNDAEKAAAKLTMQRVARGVYEKTISETELQALTAPLMKKNDKGEPELKEQVTEAELREFLKLAEAAADKANVPREPFEINIIAEIDKAIDAGMKAEPAKSLPEKDAKDATNAKDAATK